MARIPNTFGIGIRSGCAMNELFELNCIDTFGPPQALAGNIQVYDISDTQLHISTVVVRTCFDRSDSTVGTIVASSDITDTLFSYSELNNLLLLVLMIML
ncbi:hypothetical protein C2S52_006617 [Perilla frutescens var. hirtella]|nr:hypothetical protein C2S52_006617 [Perilla frutescens var. hirtella]